MLIPELTSGRPDAVMSFLAAGAVLLAASWIYSRLGANQATSPTEDQEEGQEDYLDPSMDCRSDSDEGLTPAQITP
jgi:hypothetical protein